MGVFVVYNLRYVYSLILLGISGDLSGEQNECRECEIRCRVSEIHLIVVVLLLLLLCSTNVLSTNL